MKKFIIATTMLISSIAHAEFIKITETSTGSIYSVEPSLTIVQPDKITLFTRREFNGTYEYKKIVIGRASCNVGYGAAYYWSITNKYEFEKEFVVNGGTVIDKFGTLVCDCFKRMDMETK